MEGFKDIGIGQVGNFRLPEVDHYDAAMLTGAGGERKGRHTVVEMRHPRMGRNRL